LAAQRGQACTHNVGHPFVARIGNDTQQFLDTFASDRRGDAKFGKVSAERFYLLGHTPPSSHTFCLWLDRDLRYLDATRS
jgi:hypothetical protein